MSYRDDHEATRARLEALERELAETRTRAEEAEGHAARLRSALTAAGHDLPEADGVGAVSLPAAIARRPDERPIVVVLAPPTPAPAPAARAVGDLEDMLGRASDGDTPDAPERPATAGEKGLAWTVVFYVVLFLVLGYTCAMRS